MPISYTVIMIRSAGAKFPAESSDSNLTVKTQCVKQMWLSGNCRASLVVSVSSKMRLAWLIQSSLQQPLQQSTVVAVFLYVLLLWHMSLSSLIVFPQKFALLSHVSPWHLRVSECLPWTAVMTVSLALWVLELSYFSAWNKSMFTVTCFSPVRPSSGPGHHQALL
jgi:hypothetical protein